MPVRLLHRVAFSSEGAARPVAHADRDRRAQPSARGRRRSARRRGAAVARCSTRRRSPSPRSTSKGCVLRSNGAFAKLAPAALKPATDEAARLHLRRRRRARSGAARRRDQGGQRRAGRDRRRSTSRSPASRSVRRACSFPRPTRTAETAPARSCSRSTPPSSAPCRRVLRRARRCRRSASSPAASPTTSTTC